MTRADQAVGVRLSRLTELLVVASLVVMFVWYLAPQRYDPTAAQVFADAQNLREHGRWQELHRERFGELPREGGHRFVMATWTAQLFAHDREHLDRYFTPGTQDPEWKRVADLIGRGADPWPTLRCVTSESTHYCGRAAQHLATATQVGEVVMADDNEGTWNLRDGTVNVLYGDGDVRTYTYRELSETFGVGDLDKAAPMPTWGPDAPIPACRKLDN